MSCKVDVTYPSLKGLSAVFLLGIFTEPPAVSIKEPNPAPGTFTTRLQGMKDCKKPGQTPKETNNNNNYEYTEIQN